MAQAATPASRTLTSRSWAASSTAPANRKHANIGISLPGTGETPAAPVFIDGEKAMTLRGENIAGEFEGIVEDYIERRYGVGADKAAVAE